jgi:hypothetical protein
VAESEKAATGRIKVSWQSGAETFEAEVDRALLVVPEGEGQHRVFFAVTATDPRRAILDLASLVATVLEMAAKNAGGAPLKVALQALGHALDDGRLDGEFSPETLAFARGKMS